jgi:hypothetical protein
VAVRQEAARQPELPQPEVREEGLQPEVQKQAQGAARVEAQQQEVERQRAATVVRQDAVLEEAVVPLVRQPAEQLVVRIRPAVREVVVGSSSFWFSCATARLVG